MHAVHEHVPHARGEQVRLEDRAALGERLRVEDGDVGPRALAEDAAVGEADPLGGLPRQPVDGVLGRRAAARRGP